MIGLASPTGSDAEVDMDGAAVREVFETILPDEALGALVEQKGFQQRERKLEALSLIRSAVISAASGRGGRQADMLRHYFESGAPEVARGAAYKWFDESFEQVMATVCERAMAYAASLPPDLPGVLGRHVRDWVIADSTTVKLDDTLIDVWPGAGKYAALKLHKLFSVGVGTTVFYHLSPAREHDSRHLDIDAAWKGLGLLADLGYASLARLQACEHHGVRFVIRLKENWKPKVDSVASGDVRRTFLAGADFDALIDQEILVLDGQDIDADVRLGAHGSVACRLVGVEGPKGYCWYLTNLPRDVLPDEVRKLYAVRWEIELDNKLDKSCQRLDEIGARNPHTVRALVHAAITGSIIVCLLTHHHRLEEGHPPKNRPYRTRPPLHPQTLGRMVAVSAYRVALAFEKTGSEADAEWAKLAKLFTHQGSDPNWRSRPSVLDQLRGWKIRPARPRRAKAGALN